MYAKTIKTCSLPYGWQEMVKFVRKSPHIIEFGGGNEIKHSLDSQVQIILDHYAIIDALNHIVHPSDPFCTDKNGNPSEDRIMAYVNEYSKDFDSTKFVYTYYGEMTEGFTESKYHRAGNCSNYTTTPLNLISKLRDGLKFQIDNKLPSNRNVVTLLNNSKWNMMTSTPCWNILWIRLERIDSDGTVWVSVSTWYRSHDLTDAWESNFIAQVTFIVNEILKPLNAKILFWHESNASLHIYKHNLPMAMKMKEISVNPNLIMLQRRYDSE